MFCRQRKSVPDTEDNGETESSSAYGLGAAQTS